VPGRSLRWRQGDKDGNVTGLAAGGVGVVSDLARAGDLEEAANAASKVVRKFLGSDHEPVPGDGPDPAAGGDHGGTSGKGKDDSTSSPPTEKTKPSDPDKGAPAQPKEHDDSGSGSGDAGDVDKCSFSPDTKVLMAGDTTKAIGKIKPGDKVESANPKNGEHVGAKKVLHVWINHDTDLLDLTVQTSPGHDAVLHTTANHPFWDATTHRWVPAGHLVIGHALTTPDGHKVHVAALHTTPGTANRWNLTVDELHTYYVVAGGVPVLVHNTNVGCPTGNDPEFPTIKLTNYRGRFNAWLNKNGFQRLPDDWDAHHAIPQEFRERPDFAGFDFDAPSNMRGIPGSRMNSRLANVHQEITNQWKWFGDMNPNATRADIEDFADRVDRGYGDYYWRDPKPVGGPGS
jgi:Pretoxin HINT domain